jgi:hypothetical protein
MMVVNSSVLSFALFLFLRALFLMLFARIEYFKLFRVSS